MSHILLNTTARSAGAAWLALDVTVMNSLTPSFVCASTVVPILSG